MTTSKQLVSFALAAALACAAVLHTDARAQPLPRTATIRVAESSGLRRTEYPVRAAVAIAQGALADETHARLRLGDADVPSQFTVMDTWPDGSARLLDVDFNVTLAPGESRTYQLQYGPGVTAPAPPRGMTITQDLDTVQLGSVKFSRSGAPLIASASYVRSEFIGQFPDARNSFSVVDTADLRHRLASGQATKTTQIMKRGPLMSALQYLGAIALDSGYSVEFTLTFEMPNSKSWVKMTATLADPMSRVKTIEFETPLAFGAFPWTWDFGTENGSYGAFRAATDAVVFTQIVGSTQVAGAGALRTTSSTASTASTPNTATTASNWKIETGGQAELRPSETSTGRLAAGWGHLQGSTTAVAFGIGGFGDAPGTYAVSLNGLGQVTYRFSPVAAQTSHRLAVYQHFVSTPVPIGAATTPASMLHPPTVTVTPN